MKILLHYIIAIFFVLPAFVRKSLHNISRGKSSIKTALLLFIILVSPHLGYAQVDLYNEVKGLGLKGKVKKMTTYTNNYIKDNSDSLILDRSEIFVEERYYSEKGVLTKRSFYHQKDGELRIGSHYDVIFENGVPFSGTFTNGNGDLLYTTAYQPVSDTSYGIADIRNMEITQTLIIRKNRNGRFCQDVTSIDQENGKARHVFCTKTYDGDFLASERIEGYFYNEDTGEYESGSLTNTYTLIQKDEKGNPLFVIKENSNDEKKLLGYQYEYYQ